MIVRAEAYAPGRVELLGNHTDYNGGYVLSAAIDRGVTMVGHPLADGKIVLHSNVMSDSGDRAWCNYPLGVVKVLPAYSGETVWASHPLRVTAGERVNLRGVGSGGPDRRGV